MEAKINPAKPEVTETVVKVVSEAVEETVDLIGLSRKQAMDIMTILGTTNDYHLPESEVVYFKLRLLFPINRGRAIRVDGGDIGLFRIER